MVDNKKVESDIKEKLVATNRITKVVKEGEGLDLQLDWDWTRKIKTSPRCN